MDDIRSHSKGAMVVMRSNPTVHGIQFVDAIYVHFVLFFTPLGRPPSFPFSLDDLAFFFEVTLPPLRPASAFLLLFFSRFMSRRYLKALGLRRNLLYECHAS